MFATHCSTGNQFAAQSAKLKRRCLMTVKLTVVYNCESMSLCRVVEETGMMEVCQ